MNRRRRDRSTRRLGFKSIAPRPGLRARTLEVQSGAPAHSILRVRIEPGSVGFIADPADPWSNRIAAALPGITCRFDCAGMIPGLDRWPMGVVAAETVVIHRSYPTIGELNILGDLHKQRAGGLILCCGDYLRYREWHAFQSLFAAVVCEATAPEMLGRLINRSSETGIKTKSLVRVRVVSSSFAMRSLCSEVCRGVGMEPLSSLDWKGLDRDPAALAIWDVPLLEAGWREKLAAASRSHRVIALLGVADRQLVSLATAAGAAACLDLPFDPLDLAGVLERISANPIEARGKHTTAQRSQGHSHASEAGYRHE